MSNSEVVVKKARLEDSSQPTATATVSRDGSGEPRGAYEPAMTFPYKLDPFQQRSIDFLEAGDSVLVSAHTSAGKTTVAYYAIAKALQEKKRVIFTSPIKALSNQKFREFGERFDSVGLMTGDTTIKPDSDCLVMTTEILRSMLYRGTEMLREVGCVIFDEVHYMRDKSRGVVWEETIVMLPAGCQYVFLSATIPNAREFSDWVEHVHPGMRCHVIHTDYRPTPLQHFLHPQGADGIFLVVDDKSEFNEENFRKAMVSIGPNGQNTTEAATSGKAVAPKLKGKDAKGKSQKASIMSIVRLVMDRDLYPVIVFGFAKAECERNALALSQLNFNNDEESALVSEVFGNAIESLGEEDRKLPAIENLLPLLKRGVGIHHSGLLPILKEVVEVLFQAGLVKCLFSTETFSMGLNMPARTVIFTDVKKWDGEKQRYLTGGEYIQMSGRAGRRGLDKFGVVIAMVNEGLEPDKLRNMMVGGADVLNSSFHLTYNMVLNLLRVEDVDPEFMMVRSFSQFQRERNRPQVEIQIKDLEGKIGEMDLPHEDAFQEFTTCDEQATRLSKDLERLMCKPSILIPHLKPGRIVRVARRNGNTKETTTDFGWGICISHEEVNKTRGKKQDDPVDWMVRVAVLAMKEGQHPNTEAVHYVPCPVTEFTTSIGDLFVLDFSLADVTNVSRLRVSQPVDGYFSEAGRRDTIQTLGKLEGQFRGSPPLLTTEELGLSGADAQPQYAKAQEKLQRLRNQMESNELRKSPTPELLEEYERFKEKSTMEVKLSELHDSLRAAQKTVLRDELRQMMRVLRRLDYIDKDNLILRKGRIACEISSEDESELLLTELLFKGVLNDMPPAMIVALMSCLVNMNKTPDGFSLPEEFQPSLQSLKEVVSRLATVSVECGLSTHAGDANSSQQGGGVGDRIKPSLMELTYKWACGAKFIDIVGLTPAYEGDIVRMMRRLEELMRQLAGAARSPAIGSVELHDKFMEGIQMIKRDIVFASSLYL